MDRLLAKYGPAEEAKTGGAGDEESTSTSRLRPRPSGVGYELNNTSALREQMRGIKERPTTELPAGLQQLLVLAHKNKVEKWYGERSALANEWFRATSTATNTEMYDDWQKRFVNQKLEAVREPQRGGKQSKREAAIFRDRQMQVKSRQYRPQAAALTHLRSEFVLLDADAAARSELESRETTDQDFSLGEDLELVIPVGFLRKPKLNKGPLYSDAKAAR